MEYRLWVSHWDVNFARNQTTQFTNSPENVHTTFSWRVVYLSTPMQSRQWRTIYKHKWKLPFLTVCVASLTALCRCFSQAAHLAKTSFRATRTAALGFNWPRERDRLMANCGPRLLLASVCGQIGVLGHQSRCWPCVRGSFATARRLVAPIYNVSQQPAAAPLASTRIYTSIRAQARVFIYGKNDVRWRERK